MFFEVTGPIVNWPQNNTFACILRATSTSPMICWYLIGNTFKHRVSLTDMVITVDSFDKCIWQIGWKYMLHNLFLKQQSTTLKLRSVYVLKQRTVQQILLFGLGYGLGFACFSKLKKRWPFFSYFCLFFSDWVVCPLTTHILFTARQDDNQPNEVS